MLNECRVPKGRTHPVTTIARTGQSEAGCGLFHAELRRALRLADPGGRLGQMRLEESLRIAERHARLAKRRAAIGFARDAAINHDRVGKGPFTDTCFSISVAPLRSSAMRLVTP